MLSQTYLITFHSCKILKIQYQPIETLFYFICPSLPTLGFPQGSGTFLFPYSKFPGTGQEGGIMGKANIFIFRFALQRSGGYPCHCSLANRPSTTSVWQMDIALSKKWCVSWGDLWEPHCTVSDMKYLTLPQLDSSGLPKLVPSIHHQGGQFHEWQLYLPARLLISTPLSFPSFFPSLWLFPRVNWDSQGLSGAGVLVQVSRVDSTTSWSLRIHLAQYFCSSLQNMKALHTFEPLLWVLVFNFTHT